MGKPGRRGVKRRPVLVASREPLVELIELMMAAGFEVGQYAQALPNFRRPQEEAARLPRFESRERVSGPAWRARRSWLRRALSTCLWRNWCGPVARWRRTSSPRTSSPCL